MTPQQPRELFVSDRPVRSEYSVERSYARRRAATLGVVGVILAAVIYGLWGHHAPNPANIPTIKAEGSFKQKPTDPGGIDIPHQDVRIYDELEGKNTAQPQIEHLLPPPEIPQNVPHADINASAPPLPSAVSASQTIAAPETSAATVHNNSDIILNDAAPLPKDSSIGLAPLAPEPAADPIMPVAGASMIATTASQSVPTKKVAVTVAPKQVATGAPEQLTIDQIIKETAPSQGAAPASAPTAVLTPPSTNSFATTASQAASSSMSSGQGPSFSSVLAAQTGAQTAAAQASTAQATSSLTSLTNNLPTTVSNAHAGVASAMPAALTPSSHANSQSGDGGAYIIQLASSPDQEKARSMMQSLKQKYAGQLGKASLRLVSAEVSGRGTFYRIQSQSLSEGDANQICSALKQMSTGCILVRK